MEILGGERLGILHCYVARELSQCRRAWKCGPHSINGSDRRGRDPSRHVDGSESETLATFLVRYAP